MKKGICAHFNGIVNQTCAAGVIYRDLVGGADLGWALRLPCALEFNKGIMSPGQKTEAEKCVSCFEYQEPTPGQIAKSILEAEAALVKNLLTLPICDRIRKAHPGQSWSGVEECPVCKGRLHLSIAGSNGHIWGKCETKGCVSWVE